MTKKPLPENIQKLKCQLESGNNLIDYFLICGVNPSISFEINELYDINTDKYIDNISTKLQPKIITKFPDFDNNNDTIDDEILKYCFLKGFKPIYSEEAPKKKKYSIILDNNLFSSEYPQKYLTCFLFYEKLSSYLKLKNKLIKEDISFKDEENNITENDSNQNSNNDKITHSTLGNPKLKNYYIPKCLCIVSVHPYIKLFQKILTSIYTYSLNTQEIPLEKIITNLIIEVPIPPKGLYSIDYMLINEKITLERNENNKLQLLTQINLQKFHNNLDLNIKLEVFKHLLLGSKILFFSNNINQICEIMLSFLYLIFPFKYPFQVSSYLDKNNYNILESVSPFLLGIKEIYDARFFKNNEISTDNMDIYIVDLDNNITELISSENDFPEFPNKLVNNLKKELNIIEEKDFGSKGEESIKEFNQYYQEIYFNFFCELIKGYDDYLNLNYFKSTDADIMTSIETLFHCKEFINNHSSSEIPFYSKLVNDSQLFADFIYKRMIPRNNEEIVENLLVNDNLIKIKNRSRFFGKDPTDFLDCEKYKKNNKYIVPKPRELSDHEKISIRENLLNLNKKGQFIGVNDKNNLIFDYYIFPELNFDIYCNNDNVNDYIPPPDYSEEIEAINIDVISKSSLGQNVNLMLEMKNYLYLTWIEITAFTFWYMDDNERKYRFDQILDMIDKVIHHDLNIFNLLFDSLNKNKEHEMILRLYQKLLQLKINPSTFIYNIISNILDKEQIKKIIEIMKKKDEQVFLSNSSFCKINTVKKINIRKRTFLSINDKLNYKNKLKFYTDYFCINCGSKINLYEISKNFEGVKNDILWVPCVCKEFNLPKIKVKYGEDLLKNNNYKTFSLDEIVLHSPYNLKINIQNAVMNHYNGKLNVYDFKEKFNALFWNFIWYCIVHKLDYNVILPYSDDLEKLKQIKFNNPSNKLFDVIYDDKYYKENLNKISVYSNKISLYIKEKKMRTFKNIQICNQVNFPIDINLKESSPDVSKSVISDQENNNDSNVNSLEVKSTESLTGINGSKNVAFSNFSHLESTTSSEIENLQNIVNNFEQNTTS